MMDMASENAENPPESLLEMLMRFTPASLALAAVLATVSSVGLSQRPDTQIDPLSVEWQKAGDAAQKAGNLDAANDAYESALAADPRNRAVYVAMGQVARAQGLQGKAIRLYGEALLLDPTDVQALSGQGEAMVEKGAIAKAKENLALVKNICRENCAPATQLSAAIEKGGPPPTVLTAKDVTPAPTVAPTEQP
jgi:tetratricopeptide (TPR) repeat protein